MVLEDDEGLHDLGLLALGSRTQDRVVDGDVTPSEHAEVEFLGDAGKGLNVFGASLVVLGVEEQVADGVLALSGKLDAEVALGLAAEEGVWDTGHDTGTVTVTSVGTDGTTVGHVAEEEARIGDDLVCGLALDLAHETDTTSILFVVGVVETLGGGQRAGPEGVGTLHFIVAAGLEVVGSNSLLVDGGLLGVELVNETNLAGVWVEVAIGAITGHSNRGGGGRLGD